MATIQGLTNFDNTFRNLIIGGNFSTNPWQRGTEFPSLLNNQYSADRWKCQREGIGSCTFRKSLDVPTVLQAKTFIYNSLEIEVVDADVSPAPSHYMSVTQVIEGYNFTRIAQKPFVCSFWVKAAMSGTYCIALKNDANDITFVGAYIVNNRNTWEKKTVKVPPSPDTGSWNYEQGTGLSVIFTLMTGSDYMTNSSQQWTSGNFLSTPAQANLMDSTGLRFKLANIQIEAGVDATQFEDRDYGTELNLCQRYYEKSFEALVAPQNAAGTISTAALNCSTKDSKLNHSGVTFKQRKRTSVPSILFYNPVKNNDSAYNITKGEDCGRTLLDQNGDTQIVVSIVSSPSAIAGDLLGYHWTADADF